MLSLQDFSKKQIVFVRFCDGEKMSFSNDNFIVKNKDDSIKFQCSCYRLFIVFAVGNFSITSVLIQKAKKFGFFIAMMTSGFRLYEIIGAEKEGNTLLKTKQYNYNGIDVAKRIAENKVINQLANLNSVRHKSDYIKESIEKINVYLNSMQSVNTLSELMAYEGLSSKLYFKCHFNNVEWHGRQPRLKLDYVNSALDIGYTILFSFVDAILQCFGFDTYYGVFHKQFYMRKSLVCDMVEPFRPIIDKQIKKSINLGQIKEEDFIKIKSGHQLKWERSSDYSKILLQSIVENKDDMFRFIKSYYECFMKGKYNEFDMYIM